LKRHKQSFDNIESLLSPGMEVNGSISSQGSVRIDGKVEGKVNIKGDLIIGKQGLVKGEVKAANLQLAGRIEGNAIISGRFDLTSSGMMAGDVQCSIFTIEEGGQLNGKTTMGQAEEKVSSGKNKYSEAGEKQKSGR
jgi:cytoskeletal protein CcmA (bactofilin family)